MAREIPSACSFQVLGWRVMFALCLFRNGVWQKWCQIRQVVSTLAYILDDGAWKGRQPCKRKVRNSQIFCYGNSEFLLAAMRRQTAGAPIDQQLDRLMQAQIDENREKMKLIVKTTFRWGENEMTTLITAIFKETFKPFWSFVSTVVM